MTEHDRTRWRFGTSGLIAVLVCFLTVCVSFVTMDKNDVEEVPEALLKVTKGSVQFTTNLFKAVARKDGNVFISPVSVEMVLALAYMGATGDTAEQIASVLHLPADREDIKAGFSSLLGLLKSTENVTLELANKVFCQSGYEILPEYKAVAEKSFLSGAEELDFADGEGSRKIINSWVESKTKNKIRDLIPSGVLDEMTRLVLVNAVYFKGLWEKQFSVNNTMVKKFHLNSRESKEVPMMHKKDKFGYLQSEDLDADILQMQYQGRNVSMFILLPHDIDGISKLENKLAAADFSKILTQLPVQEVEVSVPKFKLEETTGLNHILTELGLINMFIPHEADFSGISGKRDLYVSSVLQKAFVEVNEEGSEAAAATGIFYEFLLLPSRCLWAVLHASVSATTVHCQPSICLCDREHQIGNCVVCWAIVTCLNIAATVFVSLCMPVSPQQFIANHPFVFVIENIRLGIVLFAGRLSHV